MMGNLDQAGVIPLTLIDLFEAIAGDDEQDFRLSMQYVEIYNEKINDLLNPSDANLDVREVPSRGTYVAGATDKAVSTPDEMMALIHEGNLYRTTEATKVNEVSSRSHAVLQVSVRARNKYETASPYKLGKLSMIDLAGSERANKTENTGARQVEGQNINRSLLALGNCINALADKTKKIAHVPYRDSKLTRLLKDSLGGNCLTTMIANVSPSHDQFDETLNSLKYANRAKNIKPRGGLPILINEEQREAPLITELQKLQRELLKEQAAEQQAGGAPPSLPPPGHGGQHSKIPSGAAAEGQQQKMTVAERQALAAKRRAAAREAAGGEGGAAAGGPSKGAGRGSNLPKPKRRSEGAEGGGRGGGGGRSGTASDGTQQQQQVDATKPGVVSPYGVPMPPPLDIGDSPEPLWPLAGEDEYEGGPDFGFGLDGSDPDDPAYAALANDGSIFGDERPELQERRELQELMNRQPSFSRGMRSPGLGHRNWGQISNSVSQVSAAVSQPRALQMYQLLDNMEVEESREIDQEASALLEEHIGLLEDCTGRCRTHYYCACERTRMRRLDRPIRPREGDARGDREEPAELDEEKEALQGQLGQNTTRMSTLIQELPTRIISIERLQILRLSLQNIALHVQRRERELQMQTVRRVLLRDDEKEDHYGSSAASPLLVAALSQVDALTGGRLSSTATPSRAERMLREATVRELLDTCSTSYGGGEELLLLAGGDHKRFPSRSDEGTRPASSLGGASQAAASTRRDSRSPHLSLAAVVPTLIEVQDSEDRQLRGQVDSDKRPRSPSLLARQKSIGEFVREAAAFDGARFRVVDA